MSHQKWSLYIWKKKQPYCCCGIFFVDCAILKFFSIIMKITNKVPKCAWKGPEKVQILPESPFFPPLQQISAQSPDRKILYSSHWIPWLGFLKPSLTMVVIFNAYWSWLWRILAREEKERFEVGGERNDAILLWNSSRVPNICVCDCLNIPHKWQYWCHWKLINYELGFEGYMSICGQWHILRP